MLLYGKCQNTKQENIEGKTQVWTSQISQLLSRSAFRALPLAAPNHKVTSLDRANVARSGKTRKTWVSACLPWPFRQKIQPGQVCMDTTYYAHLRKMMLLKSVWFVWSSWSCILQRCVCVLSGKNRNDTGAWIYKKKHAGRRQLNVCFFLLKQTVLTHVYNWQDGKITRPS